MFGCSVRTVERRLEEVGLTKSDLYSNISHNELVRIVRELSEWNLNLVSMAFSEVGTFLFKGIKSEMPFMQLTQKELGID